MFSVTSCRLVLWNADSDGVKCWDVYQGWNSPDKSMDSILWNQEGRNGIGQKERSSWITGWMTLADPMGHLE